MLSTFYYLIVSSILVQNIDSAGPKKPSNAASGIREAYYSTRSTENYAFSQSKSSVVSETVSNKKHICSSTEVSMRPRHTSGERTARFHDKIKHNNPYLKNKLSPSLDELESLIGSLIGRVNEFQYDPPTTVLVAANPHSKRKADSGKRRDKHTRNENVKAKPLWGEWTDWSGCSVTCGRGRMIKWRHCLDNCHDLETEMVEKMCQLPACSSKLFGIISL